MKDLSKKLLFAINLLLIQSVVYSQNLVLNPSFENYSQCPFSSAQIDFSTNWYSATSQGSPEYFNSCNSAINNLLSVPSNVLGYEFANNGSAYSGIYLYAKSSINGREYVQNQLPTNLTPCSIYELSFYVSLVDSSHYAINSIGAFVSDSAIHRNDFYCFSYYEPQVNNSKTRILSDKEGWTKIEGKFISNGGENYITIGNFDLDSEIDTLAVNNNFDLGYAHAYYYLDNVSLTFFSDANTNIIAGNDTIVAPGDSIFIGQEISNLNCTWRLLNGTFLADSTSGIWVQPTTQTTYVVEQNLCGTITYDTVTVFVNSVGLNEIANVELQIFPNPSNGTFEISNPIKEKLIFELKNALGQVIYQEKLISEKQNFELHLEKGVYFASFSSDFGVFEEKIVIR